MTGNVGIMSGNAIRILCAGDLHIGRRSSRLTDAYSGPEHSGAGAWDAIVETAIGERVDIVALSGDLVDRSNRYFEAVGPLERGLRQLSAAGIATFAVAGNHDYDVLPQLSAALDLDGFHLLGGGGRWERHTLEREGQPVLHIDGWSFPREHVPDCALDSYDLPAGTAPVLGLLHADLDQPGSQYGPVTLAELRRQPVALWLLGHIHGQSILVDDGALVVMYPGTPQAMDPGEPGVHGAVIATIDGSGRVATRRVPLSTACYLAHDIDVSDCADADAVRSKIVGALREALAEEAHRYDRLACLSCRLRLIGRTPLHRELQAIARLAEEDLRVPGAGGAEAVIERIEIATQPALDLDALARRNDPPGEVARIIQALEAGDPDAEYAGLITVTARELRTIHGSTSFARISPDAEPGRADAERLLLAEARTLLDTLVAQKEAAR